MNEISKKELGKGSVKSNMLKKLIYTCSAQDWKGIKKIWQHILVQKKTGKAVKKYENLYLFSRRLESQSKKMTTYTCSAQGGKAVQDCLFKKKA